MRKLALSCVPLALALCSQTTSAAALMDRWGTGTYAVARNCPDVSCDSVDFSTHISKVRNSNYHQTSSTASAAYSEGYNSESFANIEHDGNIALPHLRGETYASANVFTYSSAYALDGFTYSGPSQTLNLNINLEGTLYNPTNNQSGGIIFSSVYIFTDALALENALNPNQVILEQSQLDLASHSESLYLYDEWYFSTPEMVNPRGPTIVNDKFLTDSGTITLDLEAGDTFYLYATHSVSSGGQSFDCYMCVTWTSASSMDSLELDITSTNGSPVTGLTASSSVAAVPVPAAVWLMGSALMGLVGFRRKST